MYELGSGDWIGLAEAAKMMCEGRQITKTEEDVVKAGYITYEGVNNRLKIYTFARTHIHIEPYRSEFAQRITPLSSEDKLFGFRAYGPGDIFELHPDILEKLLMLRNMPSSAWQYQAVIRTLNINPIKGWEHHPQEGTEQEYWSAVFDGVIRPEIEIRWEDLRVDRVEIMELVDDLKRMCMPDATLVAAVKVDVNAANDDGKCDWQAKAIDIANRIGAERWARGEREITARNICEAVADELGKDFACHGKRGRRSGNNVRSEALKEWKFRPDKVA